MENKELVAKILEPGNILLLNNQQTYLVIMINKQIFLLRDEGFLTIAVSLKFFEHDNVFRLIFAVKPKQMYGRQLSNISNTFKSDRHLNTTLYEMIFHQYEYLYLDIKHKYSFDFKKQIFNISCINIRFAELRELHKMISDTESPWNVNKFNDLSVGHLCKLQNGKVGIVLKVNFEAGKQKFLICKGEAIPGKHYNKFTHVLDSALTIVEVRQPLEIYKFIGYNWSSAFMLSSTATHIWIGNKLTLESGYTLSINHSTKEISYMTNTVSFEILEQIKDHIK